MLFASWGRIRVSERNPDPTGCLWVSHHSETEEARCTKVPVHNNAGRITSIAPRKLRRINDFLFAWTNFRLAIMAVSDADPGFHSTFSEVWPCGAWIPTYTTLPRSPFAPIFAGNYTILKTFLFGGGLGARAPGLLAWCKARTQSPQLYMYQWFVQLFLLLFLNFAHDISSIVISPVINWCFAGPKITLLTIVRGDILGYNMWSCSSTVSRLNIIINFN